MVLLLLLYFPSSLPRTTSNASFIPQVQTTTTIETLSPQIDDDTRFTQFEHEVSTYFSSPTTCDTQYIYCSIFCDASPGNGLKLLIQPLILGFILNRKVIVAIHRRSACEGQFLDFAHENVLVINTTSSYVSVIQHLRKDCNTETTWFQWTIPESLSSRKDSLACFDFPPATIFSFTPWTELLSDVQFNPTLTLLQRQRAQHVFSIGIQTASGLLLHQVMRFSPRVQQELFALDYFPGETILNHLRNPHVLKIGLHIRHLPFIVSDEGGQTKNIDKRAFKCVAKALLSAAQTQTSNQQQHCLLLVAVDMDNLKNQEYLSQMLKSSSSSSLCEIFYISRTRYDNVQLWGGGNHSTSAWEKRKKDDVRGQLEAYLDFYLLAEFSHVMVVGSGSTFSNLMAVYNSGKRQVKGMWEFNPSSCKDKYFAYAQCCVYRERWRDAYTRQGVLQPHEKC